tara:strand:+ start:2553 stop:3230 length:678 start_codon:yes stop_codon:yes gene_type:complete
MNSVNQIGANMGLNHALSGTSKDMMAKDEFLKLLVTQLSHQDPMQPMESHQFASQLAQFSSLEQLQNLNGTMQEGVMSDFMMAQSINSTLATTLIGKEATAVGNDFTIQTDELSNLSFNLDGPAQTVTVTIRDAAGNVVNTITETGLSGGEHSVEWDGKNSDGMTMPEGDYSFSVLAVNADNETVGVSPVISGQIEGVTFEDGNIVLMINGNKITMGDVIEISQS